MYTDWFSLIGPFFLGKRLGGLLLPGGSHGLDGKGWKDRISCSFILIPTNKIKNRLRGSFVHHREGRYPSLKALLKKYHLLKGHASFDTMAY
jgi:hypothetical protein